MLLPPLAEEIPSLDPSDDVEFVVGVVNGDTTTVAAVRPLQVSTSSSSRSRIATHMNSYLGILLVCLHHPPLQQFLPHMVPERLPGEGVKQTTSPDCFIILLIFIDHLARIPQYKSSVENNYFYAKSEIRFISTSQKEQAYIEPTLLKQSTYHSHCIIYARFLCRSSCLLLQCRVSRLCGRFPLRGHDEACTNY